MFATAFSRKGTWRRIVTRRFDDFTQYRTGAVDHAVNPLCNDKCMCVKKSACRFRLGDERVDIHPFINSLNFV